LVSVGYLTAKTDDPTVSSDTALAKTATRVGAKMPLGKMSIAADIASYESELTSTVKMKASSTSIMFKMAELGPGLLGVGYNMSNVENHPLLGKSANTKLTITYDVEVAPGAGIQGIYYSDTETPDGGTAVTASFIGAGFAIAF